MDSLSKDCANVGLPVIQALNVLRLWGLWWKVMHGELPEHHEFTPEEGVKAWAHYRKEKNLDKNSLDSPSVP